MNTTTNDQMVAEMAASEMPEGFDPRDEPMPFLSNFQDIFLSLGVIILLVGLGLFIGMGTAAVGAEGKAQVWVGLGFSSLFLLFTWFLSDVLVRKRRRILPGIVLCITFLTTLSSIGTIGYGLVFGETVVDQFEQIDWSEFSVPEGATPDHGALRDLAGQFMGKVPWSVKAYGIFSSVLSFVGAWLYYRRFRLPFAAALTVASVIGVVVMGLVLAAPYDALRFAPAILFGSGLTLLVAAVANDMRDPERVSRFSGNGFWMHLFAAPAILTGALVTAGVGPNLDVPAMVQGDFSQFFRIYSVEQAFVTLGIIALFALVSLLLNRRALVVSGLISAGVAIGVIVQSTGLDAAGVAATTLVVLGGGILLLGIGWHAARRVILSVVPSGGFWNRIFPRNEVDG